MNAAAAVVRAWFRLTWTCRSAAESAAARGEAGAAAEAGADAGGEAGADACRGPLTVSAELPPPERRLPPTKNARSSRTSPAPPRTGHPIRDLAFAGAPNPNESMQQVSDAGRETLSKP